MGTNIFNSDTTASNNTSFASIGIQGTNNVSNFDNALRAYLASHKELLLDYAGANTLGGSADALTITPASGSIDALYDGLQIGGRVASDNATTTPTLNAGSSGAKVIKKSVLGVETALAAGDMQTGQYGIWTYRSAWDSASGAWEWSPLEFGIDNAGIDNVVEDTTPQLGGALDTNSKPIYWSKGADVASATALALGTDGNIFDITGTTDITSIDTWAVGGVAILQFDGILTFTHHATDLILPAGANITTAAGDQAIMYEYASGDWRCLAYTKANGTPIANLPMTAAALETLITDDNPLFDGDLGLQTIWMPAGAFTLDGTTPPAAAVVDDTVNYAVLDFDASSDESVWFTIAFPKNFDDGTLTYRVFWTTANTGTEGVAWALRADADTDNDAIEIGGTPVLVTDDNQSAAGDLLVTAWSSAVTIADSVADGDLTVFELYRDVSNANDDMTEDARLIGIQIRYNTDALKDD